MPEFIVYVDPEEIGLERLERTEFEERVKALPRESCIRVLAALNFNLTCFGVLNDEVVIKSALTFFPVGSRHLIKRRLDEGRVFLSPTHTRLLLVEFIRIGVTAPEGNLNADQLNELGTLLTNVVKFHEPEQQEDNDGELELLRAALGAARTSYMDRNSVYEDDGFSSFLMAKLDQDEQLKERMKSQLDLTWEEIMLPYLLLFMRISSADLNTFTYLGGHSFEIKPLFGRHGVTRKGYEWFLQDAVFDARAGATDSLGLGFGEIVKQPYIRLQSGFMFADQEFAIHKFVHAARSAWQRVEPGAWLGKLGEYFDQYVRAIITEIAAERRKARVAPEETRQEVDAAIAEAGIAVIIESKSAIIRADIELGGNAKQALEYLESKILPRKERPKGMESTACEQLITRILAYRADPSSLGLPCCKHVVPLLVTRDRFLANMLMTTFIRKRCEPYFTALPGHATIPVIAHVSELELLLSLANKISVGDALLDYVRQYGTYAMSLHEYLVRRFPGVSRERHHATTHENPIYRRAIEVSNAANIWHDVPRCPTCGAEFYLESRPTGVRHWICAKCVAGRAHPATEQETDAYLAMQKACVDRLWRQD
jgi:hypothetical protein